MSVTVTKMELVEDRRSGRVWERKRAMRSEKLGDRLMMLGVQRWIEVPANVAV